MWNTVSVHIPENVSSGSHLHVMPYIDKAGKLLANAARGEWGCVSDLKGLDKRHSVHHMTQSILTLITLM